ncbi:MAG: heavy metal translocating P-type ATPase [Lachnospiraceae bacterium]|nr:heavy metal translocating P-type ATPase [Lachnospiraceae bacterium]
MKFVIKHELRGRIRIHIPMRRMSYKEADTLQYYLQGFSFVTEAKVYERTADAIVKYACEREEIIDVLRGFHFEDVKVPESFTETSGRELSAGYYDKIVSSVVLHYGVRLLIPEPVRTVITGIRALKYIARGLKTLPEKKLKVELLDTAAIITSKLTGDYQTASSVMFLLNIGDTLEEWTHKKSVDDLARRMSLNVSKVWLVSKGTEVLTDADRIKPGDRVVVRMGNIIPFDGRVTSGDAMVNQASMTGEAIPVRKDTGKSVFAGTVVEEGEITVSVTHTGGSGRFDKIVKMIEESEKLKSSMESKAENLADRLVPYTLSGSALTYLFTRNITKAVSVLMVDYSCALKLAMPISVLSAIREAGRYNITVKGGKFLEAVSEADTIVFDKTGTLTKAEPTVYDVVSFDGEEPEELLREAACLEEHFPHSIANAVVKAAEERGLGHDEFHTKVNYIVAHGISTTVNGKKAVIGSYHFVFEDEKVKLPAGKKRLFDSLPEEYSHLYYAKEGKLAAVILIEDPLREEAADVIQALRELGLKTVMMTGDSERTARAIAERVGVDKYYAEVLPEDKAGFIEDAKIHGSKVIMIGDGINDSPALSASDAGIAISEGAEIARQIADITVGSEDLLSIVLLKKISDLLMKRIRFNYRSIVSFNTGLIVLGVAGVLPPATSALLHNSSTIALGIYSMTDLT